MRRVLTALLMAVAAGQAISAPLPDLIEERARATYGDRLPHDGVFDITLKSAPDAEVAMLAEFWMDLDTGQFLTNAVLTGGDIRRLSGLALITVPVPVPNRKLMPAELVSEADLRIEHMPLGRVGGYAVTDPAQLIGKEVRRVLTAGRPVQVQSVVEPRLIDRGDRVDIRFDDGGLALTAPGRALSDAHRGQDLRVVNLISNKTITAIAIADGTVEIAR